MNRNDAKKIAETITNEQLKEMFDNAKSNISNWEKVSNVNKGITKGVAWNILAKDFDVNSKPHIMAKINMVREFGEFLPQNIKPEKKKPKEFKNPVHQKPDFDFWDL